MHVAMIAYTRLVLTALLLVGYYGIYAVRLPLRRRSAVRPVRHRKGGEGNHEGQK